MTQEERQEAREQLDFLNEDGTAIGYLVDGYLVGNVVDSGEEYISFEWWIPIETYEKTDWPITTYHDGTWDNPSAREILEAETKRKRQVHSSS